MVFNPQLNARIVAWLRQRPLGVRHGNGECWTLAEDALLAQRARTSRQLTRRFSARADYVWGEEVRSATEIAAGDIIQMRGYSVRSTVTTRDLLSGPAGRVGMPWVMSRPHHTAIVLGIVIPGRLVEVIEQNVPMPGSTRADRLVQINRFALVSCETPAERRFSDAGDPETVSTRYEVLGGRVWVYHPQA